MLYKAYGYSVLLVLNGTPANGSNAHLGLNWRYVLQLSSRFRHSGFNIRISRKGGFRSEEAFKWDKSLPFDSVTITHAA